MILAVSPVIVLLVILVKLAFDLAGVVSGSGFAIGVCLILERLIGRRWLQS